MKYLIFALIFILFTGCASVPQLSPETTQSIRGPTPKTPVYTIPVAQVLLLPAPALQVFGVKPFAFTVFLTLMPGITEKVTEK
jgi:hypothetical protein